MCSIYWSRFLANLVTEIFVAVFTSFQVAISSAYTVYMSFSLTLSMRNSYASFLEHPTSCATTGASKMICTSNYRYMYFISPQMFYVCTMTTVVAYKKQCIHLYIPVLVVVSSVATSSILH